MATITSNTYLDWWITRTAWEAWTCNGWILTVRTDTRWHSNSPASMLGSLWAVNVSSTLWGWYYIDATKVRWLPITWWSGTTAIWTTITQWWVTWYFLWYWGSLTSAPSTTIWATWFIKLREVSGGTFSAWTLSWITATASWPDVTWWIEVVHDQAIAITVPRLWKFQTRWDWFYLNNTNWIAWQVLQTPTNWWGTWWHIPAVWIETSPWSNEYDIYPALLSTWFLAANLSTDIRSKFVQTLWGWQIRIWHDWTTTAWFVPDAWCKVRIPNIIGRQTTSANRSLNLVPHATLSSRPDFTTNSAWEIDIEYFINDWYHLFSAPYKVSIINSATFDIHSTNNEASPCVIDNYTTWAYTPATISLTMVNNPLGWTISNSRFVRPDAASNWHCISMTWCSNFSFDNVRTWIVQYARSTWNISFSQCRNIVFNNITTYCATLVLATCANASIKNMNYIDRLVWVTNSTTWKYAVQCTVSSDNILVDWLILSYVDNLWPYSWVFNASNCSNLTFRNVWSFTNPVNVNATAAPAYIFQDSWNNDWVRIQRCYLSVTRTAPYVTVNTSKNITFENVQWTIGSQQTLSVNTLAKWIRCASNSVSGWASVYGSHWFNMFLNNTTGRIWLAFNEPTAFSFSQYEAISLWAWAWFTSAGQIVMPNIWDQIIFTMPYNVLWYTALANIAPTITWTNTGNFTYEYDIDTWSGFTGSFKTLNATNLSSETISQTWFKLKFRITTITFNAWNALTYIRIDTISTALAQQNNLYPLDYAVINLTWLDTNSRVQIYDISNWAELFNSIVSDTSLTYSTPYVADFNARIRIMKQSWVTANTFIEIFDNVTIDWLTRSVTPTTDAIYNQNAIDGSLISNITIDDGLFLVNVNTLTISLQNIYAYETYWLYTEEGIRDEERFITAIDQANYSFESFKIKNTQWAWLPLVITGWYMKDSVTWNSIDVIDTSGWTIFLTPEHVVPFTTSGSWSGWATASEIWSYSSRALTTAWVSAIQNSLATSAQITSLNDISISDIESSTILAKEATLDTKLWTDDFLALK